jgi:hypothetical protein
MNAKESAQMEADQALLAAEPVFSVKAVRPFLAGDRVREPGETVKLCEVAARAAIRSGAAVGTVLSPQTLLFETPRKEESKPPAPERNQGTTIRVLQRTFYDPTQARSFGPEDRAVEVYCELPWEVLSDPDQPLKSRRGPVIELVGKSPEYHRRVIAEQKRQRAGLPTAGQPCQGNVNRFGATVV